MLRKIKVKEGRQIFFILKSVLYIESEGRRVTRRFVKYESVSVFHFDDEFGHSLPNSRGDSLLVLTLRRVSSDGFLSDSCQFESTSLIFGDRHIS